MTSSFSPQELQVKVRETKLFLNKEMQKFRLKSNTALMSQSEIHRRMDMIHEAERVGIRHLDESNHRKLSKLVAEIDAIRPESDTLEMV